jgi:PPOX class probable F420-dependent enzyme
VAAGDLARERYLSLATFRKNGAEVRTPIWFAVVPGEQGDPTLWVVTGGDSGKVKRLRHNPRVRVAPSDVRGIVHGPWREGTARVADDPEAVAQAHAMMRAKYGWQATLLDLFSRLSGRIRRRAWLAVEVH